MVAVATVDTTPARTQALKLLFIPCDLLRVGTPTRTSGFTGTCTVRHMRRRRRGGRRRAAYQLAGSRTRSCIRTACACCAALAMSLLAPIMFTCQTGSPSVASGMSLMSPCWARAVLPSCITRLQTWRLTLPLPRCLRCLAGVPRPIRGDPDYQQAQREWNCACRVASDAVRVGQGRYRNGRGVVAVLRCVVLGSLGSRRGWKPYTKSAWILQLPGSAVFPGKTTSTVFDTYVQTELEVRGVVCGVVCGVALYAALCQDHRASIACVVRSGSIMELCSCTQ